MLLAFFPNIQAHEFDFEKKELLRSCGYRIGEPVGQATGACLLMLCICISTLSQRHLN